MTSAPAIGFEYRPSVWPARLQAATGLLAAGAVLSCGLPSWAKCIVVIGVLTGMVAGMRVPLLPAAVGWNMQSGWTLRMPRGDDQPARLGDWRILGAGVVLRLVDEAGKPYVLWLLADNCDPDTRRRLRMRLASLPVASTAAASRT